MNIESFSECQVFLKSNAIYLQERRQKVTVHRIFMSSVISRSPYVSFREVHMCHFQDPVCIIPRSPYVSFRSVRMCHFEEPKATRNLRFLVSLGTGSEILDFSHSLEMTRRGERLRQKKTAEISSLFFGSLILIILISALQGSENAL